MIRSWIEKRAFWIGEVRRKPRVDCGEEQFGIALARSIEHAMRKVNCLLRKFRWCARILVLSGSGSVIEATI